MKNKIIDKFVLSSGIIPDYQLFEKDIINWLQNYQVDKTFIEEKNLILDFRSYKTSKKFFAPV